MNEMNENYNNGSFNNNNNSIQMNNINKTNTFFNNINDMNNYTMPPQNNLQLTQPLNTKINYFSSPIINDDDNNIDNNNESVKIVSKSLSIKKSPKRKYAPIQIELCNNCKQIPCVCDNINKKAISDINDINSEINFNNSNNSNNKNNIQNSNNFNEFEKINLMIF